MFCSACGHELSGTENVCPNCGAPAAVVPAPAHISFEYARTTVAGDLATVATDCYESLGWELTGSKAQAGGSTVLSFRRSRKTRNKAQLVKIQRTMDDLLSSIAGLEGEKTRRATSVAIGAGVAFSLVLGVGMCLTMMQTGVLFVLGVAVGLVGIAGCVAAWPLYRRIAARDSERVAPRIEAAYDSLATACEQAQTVLAA